MIVLTSGRRCGKAQALRVLVLVALAAGCTVHTATPRVERSEPIAYHGECSHRARPAAGRCAVVWRKGRPFKVCRGFR